MKPWRVCIRYASGGPGASSEGGSNVKSTPPQTPPPQSPPPTKQPTTTTTTSLAEKKSDDSSDKRGGVLSSVMASLMKKDMRAAYECSLLPPEQQREFLSHMRDMEQLSKKHDLQKFKEQTAADVEVAKIKSDSKVEEIRAKREADEEIAVTKHSHQVEILRRKIDAEKEIRGANWRHQKWKAVAERERRQTIAVEAKENKRVCDNLKHELETKSNHSAKENTQQIELQTILHKQAMELESAKASAAKQRLQENNSAIQLGPSSDIQELREHEMELAQKNHKEKESQRSHEWTLHKERLAAAESATILTTGASKKSLARETIWRMLQLGIAVGGLGALVYYDQLSKRQNEEAEQRKWMEANALREETIARENAAQAEEVELKKARESADIEIAMLSQKRGEDDLKKANREYETQLLAVEQAKVMKEAQEIRLQYLESVKKHASTAAGVFLIFVLTWKVGRGPNGEAQ